MFTVFGPHRMPPKSGGITILYSIAIRTYCPTLLHRHPFAGLIFAYQNLVARQWSTCTRPQKHKHKLHSLGLGYKLNHTSTVPC